MIEQDLDIFFNRLIAKNNDVRQLKCCLIPECKCKQKDIIKAHTIQKKGGIIDISKDGHVYSFALSAGAAKEFLQIHEKMLNPNNGYWPEPVKIGINRASTINCFCGRHDKQIFSPLEDHKFSGSIEQLKLLTFRSVAYELYQKIINSSDKGMLPFKMCIDELKKDDDKIGEQMLSEMLSMFQIGSVLGKNNVKDLFLELYNDKIDIDYICLVSEKPVDIVCSFATDINLKTNGDQMIEQCLRKKVEMLVVSSFVRDGKGYVLLSWKKNHNAVKEFVQKILLWDDIPNILAKMFFLFGENTFFSIDWYDRLSTMNKVYVMKNVGLCYPHPETLFNEPIKEIVNWKLSVFKESTSFIHPTQPQSHHP